MSIEVEKMYTTEEVVKLLNVSRSTVNHLVKDGRLAVVDLAPRGAGRRTLRYPASAIEELIKSWKN